MSPYVVGDKTHQRGFGMTLTVDNPTLDSPYRDPERYWLYDAVGIATMKPGADQTAVYELSARRRATGGRWAPGSSITTVGRAASRPYWRGAIGCAAHTPYRFTITRR